MRQELTQEGYNKLIQEKDLINSVERPRIRELLKEAIALGDLSENAEYIAAKEQQEAMEKRLAELEELISLSVVVEEKKLDTTFVQTSHIVTLKDMIRNETVSYKIVGTSETDPINGKISNVCPVGHHLLGHKKGEIVEFPVPEGPAKYKILKIESEK